MSDVRRERLHRVLPWLVSAATLGYVFGFATDWGALVEAMRGANLPAFVAFTLADKMLFFLMWTFLQVTAVRRLVGPISIAAMISLRGASELLRAVSNPLADGAFLFGLTHLTRGNPAVVIVAASVPAMVHTIVLLLQTTLALPLLGGGPAGNRDVLAAVGIAWMVVIAALLSLRFVRSGRWRRLARIRAWLQQLNFRDFVPMLGWFALLAASDVVVQGLASRAFGVPIGWLSLAARIPILYLAISIPSFGNFGTRELAWGGLFSDYGERSTLIAYAFATNTLFLLMNVMIGVLFLPKAIELLRDVRRARREGRTLPEPPMLRDAGGL